MSDNSFIYNVSANDFEEKVLQQSFHTPVLADFWADWCGPCKMLSPILDKLAENLQGKLMVAKINSDNEQDLASQYGIRSLPTVKLFRNGKVVDQFVGVQSESRILAIIDPHIPRESDSIRAQALDFLASGEKQEALNLLRNAEKTDPDNAKLQIDLIQTLIANTLLPDAEEKLNKLPANLMNEPEVKNLYAQLHFARVLSEAPPPEALKETLEQDPSNHQALEQWSAYKITSGDYQEGLNGFIEIIKKNRKLGISKIHDDILQAFELINDETETAPYRRQLFNLLH